jgi:hypothetical protein
MPFHVRKLPCAAGLLIEEKQIPQNVSLFNPSKAGPYTYIRQTDSNSTGEVNSMLIHDERTGKVTPVDSPYHLMPKTVNLFRGIEDLRLCEYQGRIWFGGTSTHISESMNNELVVGYFNLQMTAVEKVQMVDIGCKPVKNVIPFVHKNKLLFLDSYLRKIYELKTNEETKEWYVETIKELVPAAGVSTVKYRGSSAPIHLHGSIYGCVVHDIIFNDNKRLVTRLSYLHHWLEFDIDTGLITFVSTSFWVGHWGIEYVSGIDRTPDGKISLYLGIQDKLPMKAVTTLSDLRVGK